MGIKTAVINISLEVKPFIDDTAFIGSRAAGEVIRKKMDELFVDKEVVTLDFTGVEEITQSFGDELIGIYIRAYGIDFIKNKVKLNNANQAIKDTFNFIASYSKKKVA